MTKFLLMPPIATTEKFLTSTNRDLADHARDPELVATFAEAVARWHSLLVEVLAQHDRSVGDYFSGHRGEVGAAETAKTPESEIELWEKAEPRLAVHLQLSTEPVRLVLRVLGESESEDAHKQRAKFLSAGEQLARAWEGTTDAVKYLSALRPYVTCLREVVEKGRRLSDVVDTLPPLFGALRMVWTCSRTYGSDGGPEASERFGRLLVRLCALVVEGVCVQLRAITPRIGFDMVVRSAMPTPGETSRNHREQKQLVLNAADVCTTLKEQYYKVKLALEDARAPPWDFPQEDDMFDSADFCYDRTNEVLGVLDALSARHAQYVQMKREGCRQAPLVNASLEDARQELNSVQFDWLCPTQLERWRIIVEGFEAQMHHIEQLMEKQDVKDERRPMLELYKSLGKPAEPTGIPYATSSQPIKDASPMIILNLAFNPPEIAIIGPVRDRTVEGLSDALPRAFTTTTSKTLFGKATVPKFVRRAIGDDKLAGAHEALHNEVANDLAGGALVHGAGTQYWYLAADSQFCSDQVGQSFVFLTLFDALEREGSWRMRDAHSAYLPLSGGGYKAHHKFFFSKKAPNAAKARGVAARLC